MKPNNRDKLIVALLINDLVAELNQAMRVRGAKLMVNYEGHRPILVVSLPYAHAEPWMFTDTRKKICMHLRADNPHLQLFINDVKERLAKLGGSLFLVGQKPQHGPAIAKLQICVEGSANTAVTLHTTAKGTASPLLSAFAPMKVPQ